MSQSLSKRHNNCSVHVQFVGRENLNVSHLKINIKLIYTILNVRVYPKIKSSVN